MKVDIKKTKCKEATQYKTLYIKERLVNKIDEIARENNTSFNNVVISMLEYCLEDETNEKQEKVKA